MNPTGNISDDILAERLRRENNDQFHILVRMHLSFVLDLNTDEADTVSEKSKLKKWTITPFNKKNKFRGVMDGAPLTQEGICQVYQLIQYLRKESNISVEGIFRRTGSLNRQQELRSLLNQGAALNLESGQYTVHDCASVLKGFLADLPEPLLTEAHYPAYCQIANLCGNCKKFNKESRLLESLQLLLLLLPQENRILLKDVLNLLNLTASYENQNKMSADSLATLYTPHLLCPRKLTPEDLHVSSQTLTGILSYMIRCSSEMFSIPSKLSVDIRAYFNEREKRRLCLNEQRKNLDESASDSSAARTVFSFIDHERTAKENEANPTERELAQLYAYIQGLPESSKKRKLIKQFNKENGYGTPLQLVRSRLTKHKTFTNPIKRHIFHKNLTKSVPKSSFYQLRSSTENILSETMMTPRSRKPVLVVSGTNIHNMPKLNDQNNIMTDLTEEKCSDDRPDCTDDSDEKTESPQIDENVPETKHSQDTSAAASPSASLTSTFREYLCGRSVLTASSPADSSFSSRTDDYSSFNYEALSASKMSSSLLQCLDGEVPADDESSVEEKEPVLKPKQFDENGLPTVFETSF